MSFISSIPILKTCRGWQITKYLINTVKHNITSLLFHRYISCGYICIEMIYENSRFHINKLSFYSFIHINIILKYTVGTHVFEEYALRTYIIAYDINTIEPQTQHNKDIYIYTYIIYINIYIYLYILSPEPGSSSKLTQVLKLIPVHFRRVDNYTVALAPPM